MSIIVQLKVVADNLTTTEEQLERWTIYPDQVSYNPHLAISPYSSHYCSTAAVLSGVPQCLPSGYAVLNVLSLRGELFIDQVTGDIFSYHYEHTLLTSLGEVDHDMSEDLWSFLNN